MVLAILQCIPDEDDPYQLVGDLMGAVPPGSCLALTHPARDQLAVATRAEESLMKSMGQKVTFRSREQVSRFFAGLELVDPGVALVQDWRPDSILDIHSAPTAMWGGVGRKPLPGPAWAVPGGRCPPGTHPVSSGGPGRAVSRPRRETGARGGSAASCMASAISASRAADRSRVRHSAGSISPWRSRTSPAQPSGRLS